MSSLNNEETSVNQKAMAFHIEVRVELDETAQEHLIKCIKAEDKLCFNVSIPSPHLGVDETLTVSDKCQAKLVKRSAKADLPFIFSICSPSSNKKDATRKNLITMECRITPLKRCQVRLTKFKTIHVDSFRLETHEVELPKLVSSTAELCILAKGNIRIQAIVQCPKLTLKSENGNIIITGTVRTSSFLLSSMNSTQHCMNTSYVYGIVSGYFRSFHKKKDELRQIQSHSTHELKNNTTNDNRLEIVVAGNLHIGTDGRIGCGRNKLSKSLVTFLHISVKGDIYNFGTLIAARELDLEAKNVLSGRHCKEDTVQRYYDRIKESQGLENDIHDIEVKPTTANLVDAVKNQKAAHVASLLERGVDPMSPVLRNGKTVKDLASNELWKRFKLERDLPDKVLSLIRAWDKQSGSIISRIIKCKLENNMEDCSQLFGFEKVCFDVNGDIIVEENSTWVSGTVTGKCNGNLTFQGKAKLQRFQNMVVGDTCHINETGIVFLHEGGTLLVEKLFKNNSSLYVCSKDAESMFHLTTGIFEQAKYATMQSNNMMQLTVLAETNNWEGNMKVKWLCLDVKAKVQARCNIETSNLCLLKIMKGRHGLGQFYLEREGQISVIDGDFVAVKEFGESRKLADIIVSGKISSKGIEAPCVIIELLKSSFIEIIPEGNTIYCLIRELRTKRASKIHFIVNEACNNIFCKFVNFSNFGEIDVKKMSPVSSHLTIEAVTMKQNGKIENCDKMNLIIEEEFLNTTQVIVKDELIIKGPGSIYNGYKSVIKCLNGPVKMDQIKKVNICPCATLEGKEISISTTNLKETSDRKWDFKNKGTIISNEKTVVIAWEILNRSGKIRSRNSEIEMVWLSPDRACLEGIVSAPKQIDIFAQTGKLLIIKCIGGKTCHQNKYFEVPEKGLEIRCPNGDVWICSEVNGRSSPLQIFSKKGVLFSKNVDLLDLHLQVENLKLFSADIEDNETSSRWINFLDSNLETNTTVETNESIGIKKATSSIRVIKNSRIRANKLVLLTNDKTSNTYLRTYDNSRFISTNTILSDCTTYVDGLIELSGTCIIQANVLKFMRRSQCMDSQTEQQKGAQLTIRGVDLLSFSGILRQNNFLSETELSAECIHISGQLESKGPLYLHDAKSIKIQGAQISCRGINCRQTQRQSNNEATACDASLKLFRGIINVKGPVECYVKDFTMDKMSTFKVHTNDHCIINTTSSAFLSGTFECTGPRVFELSCNENLTMENVECSLNVRQGSLRARNTLHTNNNSVLRFNGQYRQLPQTEISTKSNCISEIQLTATTMAILGDIESKGFLYLNDATEIKLEGAKISCHGLSCNCSANLDQSSSLALLGVLWNIYGPVECSVGVFSMDKMSTFKVHTNDYCIINTTSSAFISGTFECTGPCVFELGCDENLILENLECNLTVRQGSLRARNTLHTNNNSVLRFNGQDSQLSQMEISTTSNCILKIQLAATTLIISGIIESEGFLYLNNATEIKLEGAKISCHGLACKKSDSQDKNASLSLIGGLMNIYGPVECSVDDFTMDKMSTFKVHTVHHCIIHTTSANVSGTFECSGQGILEFVSSKNFILEDTHFTVSSNKCILQAGKMIHTNSKSVLNLNGENLKLTTGTDKEELDGEILLCGAISSAYNTEANSCLEIECRVLQLTGSTITGLNSVDIYAAFLTTDLTSVIKEVGTVKIEAANLDAKGQIKTIKIMEVKVDDILVRGIIQEVCELKIDAEYTFVNCGTLYANNTGITAPVFINCPQFDIDGEKVTSECLPTLENSNKLIVEGLLCIIVGSFVQGINITISSVMRFDFSSKMSTKLPNANDLNNWKKVVDSSLCRLSGNSDDSDIHGVVKEALKIPKVVCQLGVGSHLCKDIVRITQGIQKEGLRAFQLKELVGCLNKAHTEYSKIRTFQMDVKMIPKKLKRIKNAAKAVAKKIMETVFGRHSFTSTFDFRQNVEREESIKSHSFVLFGENTEVSTAQYTSKSLVLGGDMGIWKNEGVFESCGDIIIAAQFIEQGDKQKRLMRSLLGCIELQADHIKAKGLESKSLHVRSTSQATLQSVDVKNDAVIDCVSGEATLKELKSKNLDVVGQENICLEAISVEDKVNITGKTIEAKDVISHTMSVNAEKSALIDGATSKNIKVHSSGSAEIKQINANDINIEAETNIDIGDTNTKNTLSVKSNSGDINLNSKIKTKKTELVAERGNISLKRKNGEANHEMNRLFMRTKRFDDVQEMLNKSGVYRDLKIAEEMDLAVPEQNVVLAHMVKVDFTITLEAKDIEVKSNIESSKSVHLNALDGSLKLKENVRVEGKEAVNLTAKYNVSFMEDASVEAGEDVNIESRKDSVKCTASKIKAGNSVTVKADRDINIESKKGDGPAKKSYIISGNSKGTKDTTSTTLVSGKDVHIYASEIKSEGENKIVAAGDIDITGHTYQTRSTRKKKSFWGLMTETTTTEYTNVDKAEISGNKNFFIAGGNFSSSAGELTSEYGQTIHAKGKVAIKDIVTKMSEHKSTDVLGGLLYHKSDDSHSEQSHGTMVEDTSSMANTKIISDTSDIEWTGSSIKTSGQIHEEAKMGSVIHKSRTLRNTKSTTQFGYTFSNSDDDSIKKIRYGFAHSTESNQNVSGDNMDVGRYTVKANKFSALNAFGVKVHDDMILDVKEFEFQGAELHSSNDNISLQIELDKTTLQVSADYSHKSGSVIRHQALNIGGKMKIKDAKKGVFDCSQANVGEIEGTVDNLDLISRSDKVKGFNIGCAIGAEVLTRKPEFGLSVGLSQSEGVTSQTHLNVRGSSKQLKVNTLKMRGASLTFDDDVHNFVKHIITEDVKESENNIGVQFSISRSKTKTKGSKTFSLSLNHKDGKMTSCITSRHGNVDDKISQRINTDIDKCRKVDKQFDFSIKHEFKGKLSKNLAELGKKIGKSCGKEITTACLEEVSKQLGLPENVVKSILDIAQGQTPIQDVFDFFLKQIGKCVIPDDLLEVLEDLMTNGNPFKLFTWICGKTKIPSDIIEACLEVLRCRAITKTFVIKIFKTAAEYLELPNEIVSVVIELVKTENGRMTESVAKILKSKDGQKSLTELAKWIGGKANIPHEIAENTLEILFCGTPTNAAVIKYIQTTAKYFKLPHEIVTIAVKLIKNSCKQGNMKDSTMNILKSKAGQKNLKALAKYLDVPNEMTDFILDIMSQSDAVAVGQEIFKFIASTTNIPSRLVSAITSAMKDPSIKTFSVVILETMCKDKDLIQCLGTSIIDCKDIESVLKRMLRETANHFGISRNVVEKIEKILQGKYQPDIQIGIEFLRSISELYKKGEGRKQKLEQIFSLIQKCYNQHETFSTFFKTCSKHGFSISESYPIIQLIMELAGVQKELCESLESVVIDKNLSPLKQWLPQIKEVDTDVVFLLAKDIINGSDIKEICLTLFDIQAKKLKLPDDIITDSQRIINGIEPQLSLKRVSEMVSTGKYDQLSDSICTELGLLPNQIDPVIQIMNLYIDYTNQHVKLFTFLATSLGFPQVVTTGIKEWVHEQNAEYLADWIEKETGLRKVVTTEFFKLCYGGDVSETMILEFLFSVLKSLGLSRVVDSLQPLFLPKRYERKDITALFYTIMIEILSPHIMEIFKYTGIPSEIIKNLLNFSSPQNQCLTVLMLLSYKAGLSNEMFDALATFIIEKNADPLAGLIVSKTKMDSSLVKAILLEIRNTKCVKGLPKALQMCLLRHVGLSRQTVGLIEQLLSGTMSKCSKSSLLKNIIGDIMNSAFGKKIIQTIFGQSEIQGLSDDPVSTVQAILYSDTPLDKAVFLCIELLSKPLGVSKELCQGIAQIVLHNNPATLISCLAKSSKCHTIPWIRPLIEGILHYDNMFEVLQQTLLLIMKEIGFSLKSVQCVSEIFKGNNQPFYNLTSLFYLIGDILKMCQPFDAAKSPSKCSFLLDESYLVAIEHNMAGNNENPKILILRLFSLVLNMAGIQSSILLGIESFFITGTCESLISHICNHHDVEQELASFVNNLFSTDISGKQKLLKITIFIMKWSKFSDSFTAEIINIIQGRTTNRSACLSKLGQTCNGDEELNIIEVLEKVSDNADMQTEDLLKLISIIEVPRLSNTFIRAITSYACQNDFEPFAKWISEYIKIDTNVIKEFLDVIFHETDKERIKKLIAVFAKFLGFEDNLVKDIWVFLEGKLSTSQAQTLLSKLVRVIFTKISNIAAEIGFIPKPLLNPIIQIINDGGFRENVVSILSYFLQQLGIPKELIDGCIAFLQHRKTKALGEWLTKTTDIDKGLIFKLLEPFECNENILDGIRLLPKQIVMYLGMSEQMVKVVDDLVKGKKPEGDFMSIIKDATVQVLRSRVTSMAVTNLSDRYPVIKHLPSVIDLISDITKAETVIQIMVIFVRFFATKFQISHEIIEGFVSLLQNRDPTRLVSLFCHKVGIDQRLLMILVKVFTNQEIMSVVFNLLRSGNQNGNIKDCTVQILKSKKGQVTITELANVFGIPTQLTHLVLDVVNQSDPASIVQSFVKFLAHIIGLPSSKISSILSAINNPNIKTFTTVFLEHICDNRKLTESLSSSLKDCKDTKSAFEEIVKLTAQHFGMSSKVIEDIQQTIKGKSQLDFQIGLEIVKDLVTIANSRELEDRSLQRALSIIEKTTKSFEQLLNAFNNLTENGFSISGCISIVQFIFEMTNVPNEMCKDLQSMLIGKDMTPLKRWLPTIDEVEPATLFLLATVTISGSDIKDICVTLLNVQAGKLKLPNDITQDLKTIIRGKEPQKQCFKEAMKMISSEKNDQLSELLCEHLKLLSNQTDLVLNILNNYMGDKAQHLRRLFIFLSTDLGVPQEVTTGIYELVHERNPDCLASWIEKETGLQKAITVEFFKLCYGGDVSETMILDFLLSVLNSLGLSRIVDSLQSLPSKRNLKWKDKAALVYSIISEILSPHIMEISKYTGIPSEIITNLLNFSSPQNQCLTVLRWVSHKAGLSNEMFDALATFLIDKNADPLAGLIVNKTKMDSSLVKAILLEIRNTKSVKSLIETLPVCLLKHVGLSEDTVCKMRKIWTGKMPKSAKTSLMKDVIEDMMKSTLGNKIMQFSDMSPIIEHLPSVIDFISDLTKAENMIQLVAICVRFFAPKLEIPTEIIEGFILLLTNRDPEKLVNWLAAKIGIDEKLLMTITKAIVNREKPINILKSVAKIAGFPEETVLLLEEIIKNKKGPIKPIGGNKKPRRKGGPAVEQKMNTVKA